MNATVVRTQAEFDAAVEAGAEWIRIESPAGVWIDVATQSGVDVEAYDSAPVRAYGSATVHAYGSATVHASGSATVRAYDSATVHASGSATVHASGSATVHAYDSATVRASGSATVHAYDSATVHAYDSATVHAYGSATVHAYDSATVHAYDSATVHAYDSATVHAYDSATVHASTHVAVHLHSGSARITGGVLIDHTAVDLTDRDTWLAYKGVPVTDGQATFYKAVDEDLTAGHGYRPTTYTIGDEVTCDDWNPEAVCGGGLHFSPSPGEARRYYNGPGQPRYLEVWVPLDGLVLLDDKVKTRTCTVVREVTMAGTPVVGAR